MNQTKPITEVVEGDVIRCAALGPLARTVTFISPVQPECVLHGFAGPAVAVRHSIGGDQKGHMTYVPVTEQAEVVR